MSKSTTTLSLGVDFDPENIANYTIDMFNQLLQSVVNTDEFKRRKINTLFFEKSERGIQIKARVEEINVLEFGLIDMALKVKEFTNE